MNKLISTWLKRMSQSPGIFYENF